MRATARVQPDAVAITDGAGVLTYAGLLAETDRLAAAMRRAGAGQGDIVALCAARSIEQVTAMLAVLDLGAVVAPFDARQAPMAARESVRRLRPALVLADREGKSVFPGAAALNDPTAVQAVPAETGSRASGLAYVLHTSGSTGRPKAVMVPHTALANRCAWGQTVYPVGPGDTIVHSGSPAFDISVWSALAPLSFGATVLVVPAEADGDPGALAKLMDEHGATAVHFVPSMLKEFLAETGGAGLAGLKYLFVGGERLSPELARAAVAATPARVFNQYGPTESCIDIFTRELRPGDLSGGPVPIGEGISGIRAHVVGPDGSPAADGEEGELLVGGACLAWGYGGAPAATASAFIPDALSGIPGARLYRTGDLVRRRADGVMDFVGRVDQQVKIRGVRVEPSDVDHVLAAHPAVADAAVVAVPAADGQLGLVAHIVPVSEVPDTELRAFVADRLISAAVPGAFVTHTALPRLTSGKIDRRELERRLPEIPVDSIAAPEPPRTGTERRIAEIWGELLKADGLGRTADFLRLGGQSLLAMRMIARVRDRFGVRLPVRTVFAAPTVAEFAAVLDEAIGEEQE
ncbi:amino acid adenylation domain-containing protein [Amycolatopsis sp. NPDC058340]|uniref:non-ribosomal peptide synthetase n=1 Tax=Amycolatopsis sp. NPDC058340 TaxID=3346453 RepID=UPI00364D9D18